MGPDQFFATSRVIIVAGKGGVGKTTVTAALAHAAASHGVTTLIVEVEGKSGLASMFGEEPLDYREVVLSDGVPAAEGAKADGAKSDGASAGAEVRARALTPDDALIEYLREHGLARLSKRLASSGMLDIVATAIPGIKDILVLGKVKQIERAAASGDDDAPDLILIDAPAAGHAITFLRSARGLIDAVRVGPINAQANDVQELLTDAERCQVVLVTLPEETPVNELVETAFSLEDQVGVRLGPVVVNGLYPEIAGLDVVPKAAAEAAGTALRKGEAAALADAASFRLERTELQNEQVDRLAEALPLPQLRLPFLFDADIGPDELAQLAAALLAGIASMPAVEATPSAEAGS